MDLPRGKRLRSLSRRGCFLAITSDVKDLNGAVRFYFKSDEGLLRLDLLFEGGKVIAASLENLDRREALAVGDEAVERLGGISSKEGDVDIFSFDEYLLDLSKRSNPVCLLSSPVVFGELLGLKPEEPKTKPPEEVVPEEKPEALERVEVPAPEKPSEIAPPERVVEVMPTAPEKPPAVPEELEKYLRELGEINRELAELKRELEREEEKGLREVFRRKLRL